MEPAGVQPHKVQAPTTRFWQKIGLIAQISSVCRRQQPNDAAFEEILELIQGIIPFDAATLYLYEPGSPGLRAVVQLSEAVPLPEPFRSMPELDSGESSTRHPEPILWPNDQTGDFGDAGGPVMTLAAPLLVDGEVIGVLSLGSFVEGVLVDKHLPLMEIVSDQLAVSIERRNRMAEIQAQNEALRHAHRRLIAGQQRIVAAEKLAAVVEMAAAVNHEINNPLSVIVGQVQCLLHEQPVLTGKAAQRLRQVEQAALKIGKVNRRLLELESSEPETTGGGPGDPSSGSPNRSRNEAST